jgi:hypothetical protein
VPPSVHCRHGFAESTESRRPKLSFGARSADEIVLIEKQIKAIHDNVPGARIVRLAGAHHYVFLSNEADVLREIRAFTASLP